MMRLLNTSNAVPHSFPDNVAVDGGYAILSHTWDSTGEQTLQELQNIIRQCQDTGANPLERVSSKVRECCKRAERDGYEWVWIDFCCIDKTDAVEVEAAIRSMSLWYSQAEICYAYLGDVPSGCDVHAAESAFRTSRWHTRGWTLQELIVPETVVFFSQDWETLGTKHEFCSLLHEITAIPCGVLAHEEPFSKYSAGVLMSWASKRQTTRLEDEAYCLMGLFDITMPISYGEGSRAFQRLQLEIMKSTNDPSLFAWGAYLSMDALCDMSVCDFEVTPSPLAGDQYLLAREPANFKRSAYDDEDARAKSSIPPTWGLASMYRDDVSEFTNTKNGIECRLPIVESGGLVAAVLPTGRGEELVGLLLRRSATTLEGGRSLYYTAAPFRARHTIPRFRTISLGDDSSDPRLLGVHVTPVWRTVVIVPSPDYYCHIQRSNGPFAPLRFDRSAENATTFRLPRWLIARYRAAGFAIQQVPLHVEIDAFRTYFIDWARGEYIILDLGTCKHEGRHAPWARVFTRQREQIEVPQFLHTCKSDHVENWSGLQWRFRRANRDVQLSFRKEAKGTAAAGSQKADVWTVHVELEGDVYETLLREANVTIPAWKELDARKARCSHRSPDDTPGFGSKRLRSASDTSEQEASMQVDGQSDAQRKGKKVMRMDEPEVQEANRSPTPAFSVDSDDSEDPANMLLTAFKTVMLYQVLEDLQKTFEGAETDPQPESEPMSEDNAEELQCQARDLMDEADILDTQAETEKATENRRLAQYFFDRAEGNSASAFKPQSPVGTRVIPVSSEVFQELGGDMEKLMQHMFDGEVPQGVTVRPVGLGVAGPSTLG